MTVGTRTGRCGCSVPAAGERGRAYLVHNAARRRARHGFSLPEVFTAIVILGLLLLVAVPNLMRARAREDVRAAREAFVATHSLARRAAAQYGRLSRLHLDPDRNGFWVTVDTSSVPGTEQLATIGPPVFVDERFGGVTIETVPRVFCFDPRGLATPRRTCDLPNATVVFRRRNVTDTVTISRLGRVRR